jgi:heptosyltransferase-2
MIKSLIRKLLLFPISPRVFCYINSYKVCSRNKPAFSIKDAQSILVVKQDGIGDAILLIPFLRELRKNAPAAHICMVAQSSTKSLWDNCPYIDNSLYSDCAGYGIFNHYRNYFRMRRLVRKNLMGRKWNLGIVPRLGVDSCYSSYIPCFCGAQYRIGFSELVSADRKIWNRGYDRLLTSAIRIDHPQHEAKQNMRIIRELSGRGEAESIALWEHRASAESLRLKKDYKGSLLVAISPGAMDARRMWPQDRFTELAVKLQKELNAIIVIVGGKDSSIRGNEIIKMCGSGSVNYAGKTDIIETIDILKKCDLFIGNDSAPMHMACSAGIPVIEISCQPKNGDDMGTHSTIRFGPRSSGSIVMQPDHAVPPCLLKCVADTAHCICSIEVADVLSEALVLLESKR